MVLCYNITHSRVFLWVMRLQLSRGTLPRPSMLLLSAATLPPLSTTSWLPSLWSSPLLRCLELPGTTVVVGIIPMASTAVTADGDYDAIIENCLTLNLLAIVLVGYMLRSFCMTVTIETLSMFVNPNFVEIDDDNCYHFVWMSLGCLQCSHFIVLAVKHTYVDVNWNGIMLYTV